MSESKMTNDRESCGSKVDWKVALDVTAGDPELLLEVLDAFQIETPQMVVKIREALESNDTELLHRAAHTAKNAFYNIGAKDTGDLAFQLEMAGKNLDLKEVPDLLAQLERDMQQVEKEVAEFVRSQS